MRHQTAKYRYYVNQEVILPNHNYANGIVMGLGTAKDSTVPLYFVRVNQFDCTWALHEHEIEAIV
jgi:hypothetical protein